MGITTLYINFTMLGIGFIFILFVALWLGDQNKSVLARMPCPACRHLFGKKTVDKSILKAQEMASGEEERILSSDIFSKETWARKVHNLPVQCPACGIKCHYYPFEPLLHKGGKMKRFVFPVPEGTEPVQDKTNPYKKADQYKL